MLHSWADDIVQVDPLFRVRLPFVDPIPINATHVVEDVAKVGDPVSLAGEGQGRAVDPGGVAVPHPDLHGVYNLSASKPAPSHQHHLASIRIIVTSASVLPPVLVEVGQVGEQTPLTEPGHLVPGEHHRVRVRLRDRALAGHPVRQVVRSVSVWDVVAHHSVLLQHDRLDVAGVVGGAHQYESVRRVVGRVFKANPHQLVSDHPLPVFPCLTGDLVCLVSSSTSLQTRLTVAEPAVGHREHLALKGGVGTNGWDVNLYALKNILSSSYDDTFQSTTLKPGSVQNRRRAH